jgi:DNA-binding HxlR family transcriptional regulator
MERLGLVRRAVRPGENRRAEYSLTPLGETLRPLVGAMYEWGLLRLQIERRTASLTLPAPAPPGPGVAAVRASGPQS